jgi:hypothetical protein
VKRIFEYIYRHGATHWVRVRIPKDLKWAYPEAQDEKLTDKELTLVGGVYQRSVLQQDQARRQAGLEDDEFEELGRELASQRADFSRLLAQGRSQPILGVLQSVLHLCGLNFQPKPEEARHAGFAFLRAVVDTLDKQLQRQDGGIVDTDAVAPAVAHPLQSDRPRTRAGGFTRTELG